MNYLNYSFQLFVYHLQNNFNQIQNFPYLNYPLINYIYFSILCHLYNKLKVLHLENSLFKDMVIFL